MSGKQWGGDRLQTQSHQSARWRLGMPRHLARHAFEALRKRIREVTDIMISNETTPVTKASA